MPDIRAEYLVKAAKQIREAERHTVGDQAWWGNVLPALVNATLAAVPFEVLTQAEDLVAAEFREATAKPAVQKRVQKRIKKDLTKK